jgi:hypothetical protein
MELSSFITPKLSREPDAPFMRLYRMSGIIRAKLEPFPPQLSPGRYI